MTIRIPPFIPDGDVLFSRTLLHPFLGHLIEWVPISWLLNLANPSPSATTDLGNWGRQEEVGLEDLYRDMLRVGLRDPLIVGVGRVTRRVRLESGNHRATIFLLKGVLLVPAVAYVGDSAITSTGNGEHEGDILDLRLPTVPPGQDIMGPYPVKEYAKLSDVLVQAPQAQELKHLKKEPPKFRGSMRRL